MYSQLTIIVLAISGNVEIFSAEGQWLQAYIYLDQQTQFAEVRLQINAV